MNLVKQKEKFVTNAPQVIIIELGSQYTLLIERALRELGVRSVILDSRRAALWLKENPVRAIILSGGAASVYDKDAPQPPEEIFTARRIDASGPICVFGICYGMQWLARRLGGQVRAEPAHREYGEAKMFCEGNDRLFCYTPNPQTVWMSHGDSVIEVPGGFSVLGRTDSGAVAAMFGLAATTFVYGVQFHPEVTHTEHGKKILENFLSVVSCPRDWQPTSVISSIREKTAAELGRKKAIFGFSGGVDSTTVAAMLAPALRRQIRVVTIDGGQFREGELREIRRHAKNAGVTLNVIGARRAFARALGGVTDAEEKRRRFKKIYAALFLKAAEEFGAEAVIQGTLAPDRIESGRTGGSLIKSHHNVGLDLGALRQLHPVEHLFKYEIRALARELGLPKSVSDRQPFPGPGLFIRIVGTPITPKKLGVVRWADARVREILQKHEVYDELSQLVVAYVGVNTVGVKGDGRVYGGAIVVRAVETVDFMTASGVHFSDDIENEISGTLTRHPDIVRVWFDPTKKPPATTELE